MKNTSKYLAKRTSEFIKEKEQGEAGVGSNSGTPKGKLMNMVSYSNPEKQEEVKLGQKVDEIVKDPTFISLFSTISQGAVMDRQALLSLTAAAIEQLWAKLKENDMVRFALMFCFACSDITWWHFLRKLMF